MKKNKITIVLSTILIILISIIIFLLININSKKQFKKPEFANAATSIPDKLEYKAKAIKISEGYSLYIDPIPKLVQNDNLSINLVSLEENKIWIKVRILNAKEEIIGETGLIKPGEYLEKVQINQQLSKNDQITYKIMGYEKDTYRSAGTISLNTRIGE